MKKKILIIGLTLVVVVAVLSAFAFNYNIIKGDYNKITITKLQETTHIIKDPNTIKEIINDINNSPRQFYYNTGFTYDYLPYGTLVLENDRKKKVFRIVYKQDDEANIITDFWEINTKFDTQSIK